MVKDHSDRERERKEMFNLLMHATFLFIYGYMVKDHYMGYSFQLTAMGILYAPHLQTW